MANTSSAKKMVRKLDRRTAVNKARRSRVRTFVKRFEAAVDEGDRDEAQQAFRAAESEIMRAVTKGVIHKNTAARKVSRLAGRAKALQA